MAGRTFAIGDIHGDIAALEVLLDRLPELDAGDTIVFVGDYIDRGPDSKGVVDRVRTLHTKIPAKVVALRGNHEDSWLRAIDVGFVEFVMPRQNGCLEAMRSFKGQPIPGEEEPPDNSEFRELFSGAFFPPEVVAWMRSLPFYYEDSHAIYVHAGLPRMNDRFLHPAEVADKQILLWLRTRDFFENYRGKLVVFGHTSTNLLPPELSSYTADDPDDLWAGPSAIGIDTRAGKAGGFLTAFELPARLVYESR